jgi:hypothetical protein
MKIFPDFEMKVTPSIFPGTNRDGLEIDIQTCVRKKIKNKWYKVLVRDHYILQNYSDTILGIIREFITRCYRLQVLSNYDQYTVIGDNIEMKMVGFELDTDQRSEEDRLNNVVRYNKIKFV